MKLQATQFWRPHPQSSSWSLYFLLRLIFSSLLLQKDKFNGCFFPRQKASSHWNSIFIMRINFKKRELGKNHFEANCQHVCAPSSERGKDARNKINISGTAQAEPQPFYHSHSECAAPCPGKTVTKMRMKYS